MIKKKKIDVEVEQGKLSVTEAKGEINSSFVTKDEVCDLHQ